MSSQGTPLRPRGPFWRGLGGRDQSGPYRGAGHMGRRASDGEAAKADIVAGTKHTIIYMDDIRISFMYMIVPLLGSHMRRFRNRRRCHRRYGNRGQHGISKICIDR